MIFSCIGALNYNQIQFTKATKALCSLDQSCICGIQISGIENSCCSTTISFYWSDVEDPSGVYYILEISPSANFAGAVIRKEGLTAPAYTLAKDEALAKGNYYWRVKAEDGAENQSEWTNGQLFKVSGLDWWLVLIIVVAIIIVIIIIWRFVSVRRRDEWK